MRVFKTLFPLFLLCCFLLASCSAGTSTLGNGKVDPVEASTLRLAVGLAFTARPDTIAPAHEVSKAMLAALGDEVTVVPVGQVDTLVTAHIGSLGLDPATQLAMIDLVALIRARVVAQLGPALTGTTVVVVREVATIVRDTAAARMALVPIRGE